MQLNPVISPQVAQPRPPITPATQIALSPAVVAAQQTATVARTQTMAAPQAAGKADNPRETKSGTDTGHAHDTRANALNARSMRGGRGGAPGQMRGSLIDVRV